MKWFQVTILSVLALTLTACEQKGGPNGGVGERSTLVENDDEQGTTTTPETRGEGKPAVMDGDEMSETPSIQKVLIPIDTFNLPCADVESSPDESEIILSIPESEIENCPSQISLFPFSFSLIASAHAQDAPKPKWTYRIRCLRRCRVQGDQIEFDIPAGDTPDVEKQLLQFPALQDWQAILTLNLANPADTDKIKLLEKEGDGQLQEKKNKGLFKQKFLEKIRENVERGKKGGVEETPEEPEEDEKSDDDIATKKGMKELGPIDLKTDPPSHHLTLRVGQKWESGDLIGRIEYCRFEEGDHFRKVSLQYFNPHSYRTDLSPTITIVGQDETEVKIACKIDLQDFGLADLIIHLMIEDPNKPKVEIPWEWRLPEWKDNLHYFGDMPECQMGDGSSSYLVQIGGLQTIAGGSDYQMFLGEKSRWTGGMKGPYRFRRMTSSNPETAFVYFNKKFGEFVIQAKQQGNSLISWEAVRIQDINQEVSEENWEKIQILATVFPFFETDEEKAAGGRLCPGEIRVEKPEEECPAEATLPPPETLKPDHTVDPPAVLTSDESSLATKLYQLFDPGNTPAACTDTMLRRQSKKLAHCFYQIPTPDYLLASCVTCANTVGSGLAECLEDENISCFRINNIGRGNMPILDVPMHTATAVFPACTAMNDDSLVLDTWFAPGNWIPALHHHRVFKLEDWKSGKTTDFGLQKEQKNLPN